MDLLAPLQTLRRTPSRRDGVSRGAEEQLRIFGAEIVQRAAVLLRLRQVTSVTACAIFQRFFFRRSFAEVDTHVAAAASLHLACKLEETPRRLRDVVVVFHRLQMRALAPEGGAVKKPFPAGSVAPSLEVTSREFQELKREVICMERLILRELGFAVGLLLEHPHKYVIQFVKSVVRSPDWLVAELAQSAWSYLNDSTRTVLSCEYQPHQIATAAIYLAARARKVKLPSSPPWWELFDCNIEDVQRIASEIMRLYARQPARDIFVAGRQDAASLLLLPSPVPEVHTPGPVRSPSEEDLITRLEREELRRSPPLQDAGVRRLQSESILDLNRIGEMISERDRSRSRSPRLQGVAQQQPPATTGLTAEDQPPAIITLD